VGWDGLRGRGGRRSPILYNIKISKCIYNRGQKPLGHLCNVTNYLCFTTEVFTGTNFQHCMCRGERG